jgi:predicted nucleic acid-binding protein
MAHITTVLGRELALAGGDVHAMAASGIRCGECCRVLPFDVVAARVAGRLSDGARSKGQSPGFPDLVIAAMASAHHLTVLTGNLRHFAPLGVPAHNPFEALPEG